MVDRDEILLESTWRYRNFLREKAADEFCENRIPRIKALAIYDGEVYKRAKSVSEVTDGL